MHAFDLIAQNNLPLKLVSISIREIFYLEDSPTDVYIVDSNSGLFKVIIQKGQKISPDLIKALILKNIIRVFVFEKERNTIVAKHQEKMMLLTRALSMGDNLDRVKKQMNLLTINLQHLYNETTNDDLLMAQYQAVRNLCSFLINNIDAASELYKEYIKNKHHYIYAQPLLSSLFLIVPLKVSHNFNSKEMESLFVVSYFKDIGMSCIPEEKFEQKKLSRQDRKTFLNHPHNSVKIINGRIPLSENYFKIIESHHSLGLLKSEDELEQSNDQNDQILIGSETSLVMMTDIIAAMASDRPYRKSNSIFESLELIKKLFSDQYPQEFKLVVSCLKNFFS